MDRIFVQKFFILGQCKRENNFRGRRHLVLRLCNCYADNSAVTSFPAPTSDFQHKWKAALLPYAVSSGHSRNCMLLHFSIGFTGGRLPHWLSGSSWLFMFVGRGGVIEMREALYFDRLDSTAPLGGQKCTSSPLKCVSASVA